MQGLSEFIDPLIIIASKVVSNITDTVLSRHVIEKRGKIIRNNNMMYSFSPCSNLNWEDVADPIYSQSTPRLKFNFSPTIKGKSVYPEWISLVCQLQEKFVDISSYNHLIINVDFLDGDFSGIALELKTFDDNFENYSQVSFQLQRIQFNSLYMLDISNISMNIKRKLREICFVINQAHMRDTCSPKGAFEITDLLFSK